MMDAYQKEIYSFLTQRDNFHNMIKVIESYNQIHSILLDEFWDLVKKYSDDELAVNNEWDSKFIDWDGKWSKFFIYKKSWIKDKELPIMAIGWEVLNGKMYFGFWVDTQANELDLDHVRAYASKLDPLKRLTKNPGYWIAYSYGNLDFSNKNDVSHILPDIRDTTAKEYANTVTKLALDLEKDLDVISTMVKEDLLH